MAITESHRVRTVHARLDLAARSERLDLPGFILTLLLVLGQNLTARVLGGMGCPQLVSSTQPRTRNDLSRATNPNEGCDTCH
jgi:hypothetical protein